MSFVRQMSPLGLGHAVWCARDVVGDEPFAVILPDMLMRANPPALAQAIAAYDAVGGNIVVVEPAPEGEAHKYGIVALGERGRGLRRAAGADDRHGREAGAGDRALQPVHLRPLHPAAATSSSCWPARTAGAGGEIQLTDAMVRLMQRQDFHALAYDGITYDCGDKIGLLRANVAFALAHPELGAQAREAIEDVLKG